MVDKKIEISMEFPNQLSVSDLDGNLDQVCERIKALPEKARERYPHHTDLKMAHRFSLRTSDEWDYGDSGSHTEITLQAWRWETDEEFQKRKDLNEKQREAGKKSAQTRKLAVEKRERTLLETLKKKYENK